LRKPADADVTSFKQKKAKPAAMPKIADQVIKTTKQWLLNPADVEFNQKGDYVIAIPKALSRDIAMLTSELDVIHSGVVVGEIKGKDLIPSQSLAMSLALNVDAFPVCEVDYATAISYLRREAITLDDAPRGYVIVSYAGKPLGFVKNLGNRANNLYPQEWRILSSHLPDTPPQVL
jgi:NOL1/NOP2/fmu family ribosome biogenesis protein